MLTIAELSDELEQSIRATRHWIDLGILVSSAQDSTKKRRVLRFDKVETRWAFLAKYLFKCGHPLEEVADIMNDIREDVQEQKSGGWYEEADTVNKSVILIIGRDQRPRMYSYTVFPFTDLGRDALDEVFSDIEAAKDLLFHHFRSLSRDTYATKININEVFYQADCCYELRTNPR